jgi:hypothetical protein
MMILALHVPIVAMDMILGMVLVAIDRQKAWILVGVGACLLNPLLNLFMIPATIGIFDNGAIGASVATVLTELLMMVGALLLRPRGVMDRYTTGYALRATLAALLMFPVLIALGDAPVVAKVIAGIVTYAAASFVFRIVSVHQVRDGFRLVLVAARRKATLPSPTLDGVIGNAGFD